MLSLSSASARPQSYNPRATRGVAPRQLVERMYTPTHAERFADLPQGERACLQAVPPRQEPTAVGPELVRRQKDIFLLTLNLQDKQKETERLIGDIADRQGRLRLQEQQMEVNMQRFDNQVRKSDLGTI